VLAVKLGLSELKFFPAEAAGGRAMLKGLHGPFGDVRFCPAGGISVANYKDYLALENVSCVDGSWVVPNIAQNERERAEHLKLLAQIY
jgi:2-dehydro-3-deoxyphosphogluconate aldolase/(4S)-4-hydroxy-2-oxoglutarate aldolase